MGRCNDLDMAISRRLDRTFRITVALKGLDGLLEVLAGIAHVLVEGQAVVTDGRVTGALPGRIVGRA